MSKFSVLAAQVLVDLISCHVDADSPSEHREKSEKTVAEITIPQELIDSKEFRELIAKGRKLKGGECKLSREYFAKLNDEHQCKLHSRAYDFMIELEPLGCEEADLDSLATTSSLS